MWSMSKGIFGSSSLAGKGKTEKAPEGPVHIEPEANNRGTRTSRDIGMPS